ncbi:hypothetical protein MF672_039600 [Actinomadura sp. ATCC 31491]|uniref:Beta-ketoacyl synthase N-terminal domain-containing protein n=1 Tax=Actinomadura luzonensis TaxID=2805427 RepID=A0ABT0G5I4_9ACTN|nr:hypothetical protein [Actinomadura luzonensis]MCK2219861.1 hypothetical protein [Actinomadura luzonensis]
MLAAAAVCPQTPLLVTGMPVLAELRAACGAAVAGLLAARPDVLAVVGGAADTAAYAGRAAGSLRPWGLRVTAGEGEPVLPLSLTVGRHLLGGQAPDACQAVAYDAAPAECRALGEKLAASGERVGLLVLADGPACLTPRAPGRYDEAARPFDDLVAHALDTAAPGALAALDPGEADRLWATGRAALQVLAGAAGPEPFDGRLLARSAPFGVGYHAAVWTRRGTGTFIRSRASTTSPS